MSNGGSCMRKKACRSGACLVEAAILLCACAFFLGRATVRGPVLETQHAAPGGAAQDAWISQVEKKTASAAEGSGRVCLNTATMEELLELPGVGEKTAERILAYRDTYGKFVTTQQLLDVEGLRRAAGKAAAVCLCGGNRMKILVVDDESCWSRALSSIWKTTATRS